MASVDGVVGPAGRTWVGREALAELTGQLRTRGPLPLPVLACLLFPDVRDPVAGTRVLVEVARSRNLVHVTGDWVLLG